MSDARTLFMEEFGRYFAAVSPQSPVGACRRCLMLCDRTEVDPSERCPAEILRVGLDKVTDAGLHDWQGFTDKAALEEFVRTNIDTYKDLVAQAQQVVQIKPVEASEEA